MATKKISVNPEFFKMGKSKTLKKERKKRSARNSDYSENKELKMKLINKIKEHKQKEKERERNEKKSQSQDSEDGSIQHDLNNSLDYLQSLSAKHKSKKEKRRERKMARRLERQRLLQQQQQQQQLQQLQQPQLQHPHLQQPLQVSIMQPPSQIQTQPQIQTQATNILNTPLIQLNNNSNSNSNSITSNNHIINHSNTSLQQPIAIPQPTAYIVNNTQNINQKPDPPYGILKHGKKPLFSMYNKTLKKPRGLTSMNSPISILNDTPPQNNITVRTDPFYERRQNLNQLKEKMSNISNSIQNGLGFGAVVNSANLKPGKTLKKMKQLHTTTKRFIHLGKKNGRVGVLIKNQKTRKKILKDTYTLKKRPLSKIKTYLRKHNLIKIGSTAPEHIIRSIYENSFLAGDVYNKNVDMLLHNYLDKE